MEVKSYRDLLVWQKAIELTYLAYEVTAALPPDERFGLISQTRRASISIPANIAEGHRRSSTKDFLRFLSFSAGSLAEMETLIELASRIYSIQSNQLERLQEQADELGKMIRSLQQRLEAKLPSP